MRSNEPRRHAERDYTEDAERDLDCARRNDLKASLERDPILQAALARTAKDQRAWATAYLNRKG